MSVWTCQVEYAIRVWRSQACPVWPSELPELPATQQPWRRAAAGRPGNCRSTPTVQLRPAAASIPYPLAIWKWKRKQPYPSTDDHRKRRQNVLRAGRMDSFWTVSVSLCACPRFPREFRAECGARTQPPPPHLQQHLHQQGPWHVHRTVGASDQQLNNRSSSKWCVVWRHIAPALSAPTVAPSCEVQYDIDRACPMSTTGRTLFRSTDRLADGGC